MKVTKETINKLEPLLKEHLEADIVSELATRLNVTPEEAMRIYFSSGMPEKIESGVYGIQYLSAQYLTEEILNKTRRDQNT